MSDDFSNSIPEDWREIMDTHLDRIEDALIGSSATRLERRAIIDEVEGQIRDMVANAGDTINGVEGFRTLIASLDAPEKYALGFEARERSSRSTKEDAPKRKWRDLWFLGRWATGAIGMLLATIFLTLASILSGPPRRYYRLSSQGRERLTKLLAQWEETKNCVQNLWEHE